MKGVLIQLLNDYRGSPAYWFRQVYLPVLIKLDQLRWYPAWQPWMGPPAHFNEENELWRSGGLRRYSESFGEEYIELRGFSSSPPRSLDQENADALLFYTDGTCWELYVDMPEVIKQVYEHAALDDHLRPVYAASDHRGEAFGIVGLSKLWQRLRG
ncbi:hypothetical protein HED60_05455 [Planctomycetales bacterium ZRK34]|nr:hypothetical protein HED60_05455 [Planctomycetales bacterium ZRK34]